MPKPEEDSNPSFADRAVFAVETLCALPACSVIVTTPVWVAVLLVGLGFPPSPLLFCLLSAGVASPALVRVPQAPALTPAERWGRNMGRMLRAPIDMANRRRAARTARSLGATGGSSAAAPALVDDGSPTRLPPRSS